MTKSAFVIMPFDDEFDSAYELFIKEALEGAGFETRRADELVNHRNILQDVIAGIESADLVVADLTGANPNVFYELGVAHSLERPTILLTQSVDDPPFDLRSYRVDFSAFENLAPDHQPNMPLDAAILDLEAGLRGIGFDDSDFRNSDLIRLNTIAGHRGKGLLDGGLYWLDP